MHSVIEIYELLLLHRRKESLLLCVDASKTTMYLGSDRPGLSVLTKDRDKMIYVTGWLWRRNHEEWA